MRPTLYAIVVALVLLTSALFLVVPNAGKTVGSPGAGHGGLRTAALPGYTVYSTPNLDPVLAGYPDSLLYQVLNNTNHGPVTQLSSVTILGHYYNHGLTLLNFPGTPANLGTNPVSNWSFTVPLNASNVFGYFPTFTIWANSTALATNTATNLTVHVGSLQFGISSVCDEVTGNCGSLVSTNPALVTVHAVVVATGAATSAAPSETLKVLYFSTGSSPVTVPNAPLTLTTDTQGYASETFFPNSTIFNVPGPDHTELELIDSVNASATIYTNVSWTDHNPSGNAEFVFWLNSPQYYGGDTVTATWQWRGTNASVGAITLYNYYVWDLTGNGALLASGTPNTVAPTGSFKFALPATYYGTFEVDAYAHNSSDYWFLFADGTADPATVALNPSERFYNPGDTIMVNVATQGTIFASATITAVVEATTSNQQLFNGPVSGDMFQFTVPATAPSSSYHLLAWASTTTAGTFAHFELTITEAHGYSFWAGVSTQSAYSDGSFQAGQTVQVSYRVGTLGTTTLPHTITELLIYPDVYGLTPAYKYVYNLPTSGSISFTIPSGTQNGQQFFFMEVIVGSSFAFADLSVYVNSAPSALNYELGAGSGVTVGWLILLILIVVVAIVVVSMMRSRRKPGTMMMRPTPAPSTPAASDWKESPASGTSGGSSAPPATPPGAQ
ncbi:MAG: hypothetical protein L3K14_05870 [Thermoplasmata archaeon]|nr:hypothetical protein [Thermoplasmata archaeon]